MSNPNSRKSCVVPKCGNTTTNSPLKLFFLVPKKVEMRQKWIKTMRRLDPFGDKSTVYCCEDHFDIENDMENYIKYKLVGGRIKLKPGTVPHKFDCQHENKDKPKRSAVKKQVNFEELYIVTNESVDGIDDTSENSEVDSKEEIIHSNIKNEVGQENVERLKEYIKVEVDSQHSYADSPSPSEDMDPQLETNASIKNRPVFESGECRCCGAIKRCRLLNAQYEFKGNKEVYAHMFVDCFGLLLSHLDGEERERMICATCVTRLRAAVDFRRQVLRCEERLLLANIRDSGEAEGEGVSECDKVDVKIEVELSPGIDVKPKINYDDDDDMDNMGDELENHSDTDYTNTQETELPCRSKPTIDSNKSSKVNNNDRTMKATKPMARSHLTSRKQMLLSMKRTREKLKSALNKEKTTEIVWLEGNRTQKSTKAFANTVTIVENSYVCPFQSIFNDFYCDYCRLKFTDHEKLREHSMVHDPVTFKDAIMDSMRRLGRKKTQLDIQRIDCRLCSTPIADIETFKIHVSSVHGKMLYPVEDEFLQFKVTNSLQCVVCGQTFALFQALKKHMADHFGTYTCDVCGTHFFNENYLIAHQRNHEGGKQGTFSCDECGRVFKLKYSRDMHVTLQHRREAAFQCIKCDENFFSSRLRLKHMMAAHGETSTFNCTQCDRVYDNRKTLLDHMRRIHVTKLKHKCGVCERRFYLPSMLKDHMATHTGEKNFKCDFCGKSYPRLKSLKVHLQSHAAVKKFKCLQCSASFGQNVSLKNHVKRQHQGGVAVV